MAKNRPRAVGNLVEDDSIADKAKDLHVHVAKANSHTAGEEYRFSPTRTELISDLKPSRHNFVFEEIKSKDYYGELRRSIKRIGGFTDPLVILKDRTVVSGHSRLEIAKELFEAGDDRFRRVQVRQIETDLDDEEEMRLVYQLNTARFEIDPDTRILLHANLYPDYFKPVQLPRVTNSEANRNTAESVSRDSGIGKRQIENERRQYQLALKLAETDGRDTPNRNDLSEARKQANDQRRTQEKEKADQHTEDGIQPEGPPYVSTDNGMTGTQSPENDVTQASEALENHFSSEPGKGEEPQSDDASSTGEIDREDRQSHPHTLGEAPSTSQSLPSTKRPEEKLAAQLTFDVVEVLVNQTRDEFLAGSDVEPRDHVVVDRFVKVLLRAVGDMQRG